MEVVKKQTLNKSITDPKKQKILELRELYRELKHDLNFDQKIPVKKKLKKSKPIHQSMRDLKLLKKQSLELSQSLQLLDPIIEDTQNQFNDTNKIEIIDNQLPNKKKNQSPENGQKMDFKKNKRKSSEQKQYQKNHSVQQRKQILDKYLQQYDNKEFTLHQNNENGPVSKDIKIKMENKDEPILKLKIDESQQKLINWIDQKFQQAKNPLKQENNKNSQKSKSQSKKSKNSKIQHSKSKSLGNSKNSSRKRRKKLGSVQIENHKNLQNTIDQQLYSLLKKNNLLDKQIDKESKYKKLDLNQRKSISLSSQQSKSSKQKSKKRQKSNYQVKSSPRIQSLDQHELQKIYRKSRPVSQKVHSMDQSKLQEIQEQCNEQKNPRTKDHSLKKIRMQRSIENCKQGKFQFLQQLSHNYHSNVVKNYELYSVIPKEQKQILKKTLLAGKKNVDSQKEDKRSFRQKIKELSSYESTPYYSQTFKQKNEIQKYCGRKKKREKSKKVKKQNQEQIQFDNKNLFKKKSLNVEQQGQPHNDDQSISKIEKFPIQSQQIDTQENHNSIQDQFSDFFLKQELNELEKEQQQNPPKPQILTTHKKSISRKKSKNTSNTKKPNNSIDNFKKALAKNDLISAIKILETLIAKEKPEKKIVILQILSDFYEKNKKFEKAIQTLESTKKYIEKCELSRQNQIQAQILFNQANILHKMNQNEKAKQILQNPIFKQTSQLPDKFSDLLKELSMINDLKTNDWEQLQIDLQNIQQKFTKEIEFRIYHSIEQIIIKIKLDNQENKFQDLLDLLKNNLTKNKDLTFENAIHFVLIKTSQKNMNFVIYQLIKFILNQNNFMENFNQQQIQNIIDILLHQKQFLFSQKDNKLKIKFLFFILQNTEKIISQYERCFHEMELIELLFKSQKQNKAQKLIIQVLKKLPLLQDNEQDEIVGQFSQLLDIVFSQQNGIEILEQIIPYTHSEILQQKIHMQIGMQYFLKMEYKRSNKHFKDIFVRLLKSRFDDKYIFISFYLLSCLKLQERILKRELKILENEKLKNENIESQIIINVFSSILFKKNQKNLENFNYKSQNIMKKKNGIVFLKILRLLNSQYDYITLNKNNSSQKIIEIFNQNQEQQSIEQLQLFLAWFYFLIKAGSIIISIKDKNRNLLQVYEDYQFLKNSKEFKEFLIKHIELSKQEKILKKERKSKKSHSRTQSDNFKLKKDNLTQSLKDIIPIKKERSYTPKSTRFIPEKPNNCKCQQYNILNTELNKEIFDFIQMVTKHTVLGDVIDFKSYMNSFENHLKNLNLNIDKYEYLKQIIETLIVLKEPSLFNEQKYINSLEEIFKNDQICYHDIKNMLILQEAFNDQRIIEAFFKLLQTHKQNEFFKLIELNNIQSIEQDYELVLSSELIKIEQHKRNILIDCPFYEFYSNPIINKIIQITPTKLYYKLRYEVLSNNKFFRVLLQRYDQKFINFLLQANFLKTMNNLHDKKLTFQQILNLYVDKIFQIFLNQKSSQKQIENVLLQLYVLINFLKIGERNNQQIAEKTIQLLFFIEEKLQNQLQFFFTFVVNKIGNLFFICKMNEQGTKCKSLVFETLKKMHTLQNQTFNDRINKVTAEAIMFDIFSHFFISQINNKENQLAKKCLTQLKSFQTQNSFQKNLIPYLESYLLLKEKLGEEFQQKFEMINEDQQSLSKYEQSLISYIKLYLFAFSENLINEAQEKGIKNLEKVFIYQ